MRGWDAMGYFDRMIGQDDLDRIITQINLGRTDSPRKGESRLDPFEPGTLCDMDLLFSAETQNALSQAELSICRIDAAAGSSWVFPQLRQCLSRIEGIATYRPNGAKPDYRLCCYSELADWIAAERGGERDGRTVVGLAREMAGSTEAAAWTAYDSFLAASAVEGLLGSYETGGDLTVGAVMDVYASLSRGSSWEARAGIRKWDYRQKGHRELFLDFFIPPAPRKLPMLLDDIVLFANRDLYSPLACSAVAHYQIEITKMFTSGSDQMGRLVAIMIWRRAGMVENIMPPFSLTPAMVTERHAQRLEPYLADEHFHYSRKAMALDNWVYHCARASSLSAKVAAFCMKRLVKTFEKWVATVESAGLRAGKSIKLVLRALLGNPVVVVQRLANITGLSFTTVSGIVDDLVRAGVLVQVKGSQRNRVFEAPDGLMLFKLIDSALLPDTPVSRESVIEQSMRDLKE